MKRNEEKIALFSFKKILYRKGKLKTIFFFGKAAAAVFSRGRFSMKGSKVARLVGRCIIAPVNMAGSY